MVQRIAKLREYGILFTDIDVVLCNKVNGWRIGLARVRHSLYYLSHTIPSAGRQPNAQVTTIASLNEEEKVILLHRRLGHPSFDLLQTMYPQYFEKLSFNKLVCDACQLAKSKRKLYPSMNLTCQKYF